MSAEEIVRATMTDKGLDPEDGRLRHDLMGRFFMALHRPHTAEWAPSGACSVCWEGGWHDVRLLVFGGRLYTDMVAVWRILDAIHRKHGLTCVIDGACPMGGADLLAHEWAAEHNVVSERYPVNHVTDGQWPGAGPMRNARMLRDGKPDQAVGFPGDRGTRDMDRRCRVAGIVPWHPFGQAWLLAEERGRQP